MTPGAERHNRSAALGVGRCGGATAGSWFCIGRFAVLRRSFGRHKWRPYVCGRLNVVLRWPVRGVARRGAIYDARCRTAQSVGRVGCRQMWRGDGRFVVLYWPVRGIASVIRASQVAPLRLRAVECCFAVVIRASQVAPLRLRRLTVVWRRLVRGVARRGAIYDARCRNGTIRRPCGFFEPSGKGGLHSGGCPKILCFQIVVPHVCITFAA